MAVGQIAHPLRHGTLPGQNLRARHGVSISVESGIGAPAHFPIPVKEPWRGDRESTRAGCRYQIEREAPAFGHGDVSENEKRLALYSYNLDNNPTGVGMCTAYCAKAS